MDLHPEIIRRMQVVSERLSSQPFIVFVWGPGSGSARRELVEKRRAIREDLGKVVGQEFVFFSEDEQLEQFRQAGMYPDEYAHVRIADAVVVLPDTPGPLVESALFQLELNGKTIVFVSKQSKSAFAGEAYRILKVEEVTDEEWVDCQRVRRLARGYVESLRVLKRRSIIGSFDWER